MQSIERQDTWTTREMTEQVTRDRVPPRGFIEKMRRALSDDALDAIWNQKKERWGIVRRVKRWREENGILALRDTIIPVTTVRNPDGTYRPLDDRVIDWLKAADSRGIDLSELLAEMAERERKAEEREDRRCREEIADRLLNNPKGLRDLMNSMPHGLGGAGIRSIVVDGYRDCEPAFGGGSSA